MNKKGSDPFSDPAHEKGSDPFLSTSLQYLKGVGPRRAADFEHAGLLTIEDLLYRFPRQLDVMLPRQIDDRLEPHTPVQMPVQVDEGKIGID